jgi:hypothetical protein
VSSGTPVPKYFLVPRYNFVIFLVVTKESFNLLVSSGLSGQFTMLRRE